MDEDPSGPTITTVFSRYVNDLDDEEPSSAEDQPARTFPRYLAMPADQYRGDVLIRTESQCPDGSRQPGRSSTRTLDEGEVQWNTWRDPVALVGPGTYYWNVWLNDRLSCRLSLRFIYEPD